jgi:NitT/TauT family transport system ATP-binding protein
MVYLSQQYIKSLLPWRTVLRNVEFPLEHRGEISRAERMPEVCTALILLSLAGFALNRTLLALEHRLLPWYTRSA